MKNQPLSSGEQSKVVFFFLLFSPAVLLFVGIVPALFIAFGMVMMRKNEDFSYIITAVKICRGYIYACLLVTGISSLYFLTTLSSDNSWERETEEFAISLALIFISLFYLIITNKLFFNPLSSHSEWVSTNGIFSSKPKSKSTPSSQVSIIKGENLKQYSVADELLKWAKLKEDGHITESEFNDAREKLLKRTS